MDILNVLEVWYCFVGKVGIMMVDKCVFVKYCGMNVFGWLWGFYLEDLFEGEVVRIVCFYWKNNCCFWKI